MAKDRSRVVSSFTVIKGTLIDETYAAFQAWDLGLAKAENLDRVKHEMDLGVSSVNWLRDVVFTLSRRFEPNGRDRALVELAQAGFDPHAWKPPLLWHMTRDEFLVRDFLTSWLYPQFTSGTFRIHTADVLGYVKSLLKKRKMEWSASTESRVASGLLRLACDFGLLKGSQAREFTSYHLPDESFLYLLHAMTEAEPNARKMIGAKDWRMFLMDPTDVEREILRLHQFRKLHYEVAGSLAQLELPHPTALDYARGLCA
jgi:BrxA